MAISVIDGCVMNFGDLKDLCAFYVDDLNFGYFTETQVGRFINNAQKEVQKILIGAYENFYIKCQETPLVPSQSQYFLPQDHLKVVRLEIQLDSTLDNTTRLEAVTPNQKELFTNQTGTPQGYYLMKNKIRLLPAPDSILTLRLYYVYLITEMTNDLHVPDVPEQYQELISLIAARDCLLKDGRDISPVLEKKYADYVESMKSDADNRTIDQPRRVVMTEDFGSGGYY